MIKYECDKCKKQFVKSMEVIHIKYFAGKSGEPIWDTTLCHDCNRLVGEFIWGKQE